MNTATQTMPSPVSPYNPQSKQSYLPSQQRSYYPPAPSTETMSPRQGPNRGLGLYSMAPSHQPLVSPMMASPQSEPWSQSPSMEQEYPTASNRPDIFSAAIDPFSGFPGSTTSDMVSGQSPEAPALEYSPPPSSNVQSHRGSISSYAPSDSSECAYTPRVKGEDSSEWYTPATSEHVLQRNVAQAPVAYTPGSATLPSQTEDLYRPSQSEDVYRNQHADWSKADTASCVSEMRASADGRIPHFEMQPILPSASRIKKKRQRTTPEEATHECGVCGKFFKRSYNWKSHLETHNPDRKYPHPCTAMAGDVPCTKKFQRKTDLDRHNDSVHLKARNHKCNLCGNKFARRDTLRRHMEDGCPKRFELGIGDAAAAAASQQQQSRWPFPSPATPFAANQPRSFSVGITHSSPIPMPQSSATTSGAFPMYPHQAVTLPSPAFPS